MDWNTAWELAGEIVDLIGIDKVTVSEQEKIAHHIQERSGYKFNDRSQEWVLIPPNRDEWEGHRCPTCGGVGSFHMIDCPNKAKVY